MLKKIARRFEITAHEVDAVAKVARKIVNLVSTGVDAPAYRSARRGHGWPTGQTQPAMAT